MVLRNTRFLLQTKNSENLSRKYLNSKQGASEIFKKNYQFYSEIFANNILNLFLNINLFYSMIFNMGCRRKVL